MATHPREVFKELRKFRLADAELNTLFETINLSVADETVLKSRIAIVRQGDVLTEKLAISKERGWFQPMLGDLLRQGVSIVVNDIEITDTIATAIGRHAELPPEWVAQQNLYITPGETQGFDPHCDPHIVVVAHLYGRKEWTIFDKVMENPVYDVETDTVADKSKPLRVLSKIEVAPGDCFVIPRGLFHSAIALTPASVHLAVGISGARAVDHIWSMADRALKDPAMRADMTPDDALAKAQDYIDRFVLEPMQLPRFSRAQEVTSGTVAALSFKEVLDALPGD